MNLHRRCLWPIASFERWKLCDDIRTLAFRTIHRLSASAAVGRVEERPTQADLLVSESSWAPSPCQQPHSSAEKSGNEMCSVAIVRAVKTHKVLFPDVKIPLALVQSQRHLFRHLFCTDIVS